MVHKVIIPRIMYLTEDNIIDLTLQELLYTYVNIDMRNLKLIKAMPYPTPFGLLLCLRCTKCLFRCGPYRDVVGTMIHMALSILMRYADKILL